jgi:hypothetical protein
LRCGARRKGCLARPAVGPRGYAAGMAPRREASLVAQLTGFALGPKLGSAASVASFADSKIP